LSFARAAAMAPFDANIKLAINIIDLDGASASNPVTFGAGSGIAFNSGAGQRYGRIVLRNRVGSELLDLPLPLQTEYYLGSSQGFTQNLADSCTVAPALAAGSYLQHLSAGETCVRDSGSPGASGFGCPAAAGSGRYRAIAVAGDFNLVLAAPGAGNDGALTVTATAPSWLRYQWDAASGTTSNPSAVASFGEFPGSTTRVYQREIF
jgi:MSHA biogenesis protein MshQ